jgi:hypothetical protein
LASLVKQAAPGVRLNEHVEADGSPTPADPACEAVRREAEEDWSR